MTEKCPIFIIFLRRNIDKNSVELISKCAKTRLHQCRIKKTDIPDLRFKGEKGMEGAGGMEERGGGMPVGGRQLESPTH